MCVVRLVRVTLVDIETEALWFPSTSRDSVNKRYLHLLSRSSESTLCDPSQSAEPLFTVLLFASACALLPLVARQMKEKCKLGQEAKQYRPVISLSIRCWRRKENRWTEVSAHLWPSLCKWVCRCWIQFIATCEGRDSNHGVDLGADETGHTIDQRSRITGRMLFQKKFTPLADTITA